MSKCMTNNTIDDIDEFGMSKTHFPKVTKIKNITLPNYVNSKLPFICISLALGSLNLHSHNLQLKLITLPVKKKGNSVIHNSVIHNSGNK